MALSLLLFRSKDEELEERNKGLQGRVIIIQKSNDAQPTS